MGSGGGCATLSALRVTELHAGHGARSEGSPGADPPQQLRLRCVLEERQRLGSTSVGQRGCPLYQTRVPLPEVIYIFPKETLRSHTPSNHKEENTT